MGEEGIHCLGNDPKDFSLTTGAMYPEPGESGQLTPSHASGLTLLEGQADCLRCPRWKHGPEADPGACPMG